MNETKQRLFVAIPIPDELLRKLSDFQNQLQTFAFTAKWVNPDGIHLTLKFLGYVEPDKIPAISDCLAGTASSHAVTNVQVQGCGFFPTSRRPGVFWAGVEAPGLQPVYDDLEASLTALGFEKENRPFHPHLTLARFRNPHGLFPLVQETKKFASTRFGNFPAKNLTLFQSILHRTGAEYHALYTHSFQSSKP